MNDKPYHQSENIVRDVPRVITQRVCRRMTEDHRRFGNAEHIAHGLLGYVREINEHAESVHLGDDARAELGQAVVFDQRGVDAIDLILIRPGRSQHRVRSREDRPMSTALTTGCCSYA